MKLTQKGQVTIPKRFRDRYGLTQGSEVEFEAVEGGVLVRRADKPDVTILKAAIQQIRGSADTGFTTSDIMRVTRHS